jgi:hypothetical protein
MNRLKITYPNDEECRKAFKTKPGDVHLYYPNGYIKILKVSGDEHLIQYCDPTPEVTLVFTIRPDEVDYPGVDIVDVNTHTIYYANGGMVKPKQQEEKVEVKVGREG